MQDELEDSNNLDHYKKEKQKNNPVWYSMEGFCLHNNSTVGEFSCNKQ